MAAVARAAAPRAARRPSGPTSSARFIPFPARSERTARRGVAAEVEVESRMHANAAQLERNLMALDEECHALIEHLSTGALVQVSRASVGAGPAPAPGRKCARSAAGTARPPSRLPACGRLVGCGRGCACLHTRPLRWLDGWRERCAPLTLPPGRKRGSGAPASIRR